MIIRENKVENFKKFAKCLLSNLKCEVRCSSVLRDDCAIAASIIYDRCCLSMGRQKGKTTFVLIHAIREALKRSGSNIVVYVANESCIKICQERMAEMLTEEALSGLKDYPGAERLCALATYLVTMTRVKTRW